MKGKRNLRDAYDSFRHSAKYERINPLLGEDGLKREFKLYEKLYGLFDNEDDINNEFFNYVREWASNPEYRGLHGRRVNLDSGYDVYVGKFHPELATDPLKGAERPQDSNMAGKVAEEMSRPGSGAAKETGPRTGADVFYDPDAEQKIKEENAKKSDKSKGWEITPDESLNSAADAKKQAEIIKSITNVEIDSKNSKAAYDAYKKIYDSGNLSKALECKKAAENLESMYKRNSGWFKKSKMGKEELSYVKLYYEYAKEIASSEDGLFGGDHFGKEKEKDLEKRYKEAEKQTASLNGNDAEAVMSLMKLLADDMELELQWQETVKANGMQDKVLKSQARHVDMDTSRGYGAMWKKASSFVNPLVQNHLQAAAEAYLKHAPWSADDEIFPGAGITYRDFFTKSKELFDNRQKAREQGDWTPPLPSENDTSSNENDKKKTKTSSVVESPDGTVDATELGKRYQSGQKEE